MEAQVLTFFKCITITKKETPG